MGIIFCMLILLPKNRHGMMKTVKSFWTPIFRRHTRWAWWNWCTSVDAEFMGWLDRIKCCGSKPSAIHSMLLGKNNNTMWHVISKVDHPLPHLLWHSDLSKNLESQFKTAKATGSPEKLCKFYELSDLMKLWKVKMLIKSPYGGG